MAEHEQKFPLSSLTAWIPGSCWAKVLQDDTVEASGSGPSSSKILALFAIGLNLRPDA